MQSHRCREAKCIDGTGKPHLFVELENDRFVEVTEWPTHKQIHNTLKAEELITYTDRAFRIGLVKDWVECELITTTPKKVAAHA